MAAEMEPPPLGDAEQTDFREVEDGEDLFVSTVTTLEVRLLWGKQTAVGSIIQCVSSSRQWVFTVDSPFVWFLRRK